MSPAGIFYTLHWAVSLRSSRQSSWSCVSGRGIRLRDLSLHFFNRHHKASKLNQYVCVLWRIEDCFCLTNLLYQNYSRLVSSDSDGEPLATAVWHFYRPDDKRWLFYLRIWVVCFHFLFTAGNHHNLFSQSESSIYAFCTTNFSKHSVIFSAPTIWNELPAAIRESNT